MSITSESSAMLAQAVASQLLQMERSGLLDAERKRVAEGAWPEKLWEQLDDSGLPSMLLPENEGGFGGGWEEAFIALFLAGTHALPLPIAETLIGRKLLSKAGLPVPAGALALACADTLEATAAGAGTWRLNGHVVGVRWGGVVEHLLAAHAEGNGFRLALVHRRDVALTDGGTTIAHEPVAHVSFDRAPVLAAGHVDEDPFARGALARAALMAGALNAALRQSVTYSTERVQFGKPIGKFQAIQHALAQLASEAAAVGCAALAACRAVDRGGGEFEIAAAKLRANRSVHTATSIAHQVHGAIGFTEECRLHRATQRLWAWRTEYGSDRYWSGRVAELAISRGPRQLWPYLTALCDPA
jgi:acyl-CoA dehydrogenase